MSQRHKTALVTGSAGFVGRHMCDALTKRGYEVTKIDIMNARPWEDPWNHDALRVFRHWDHEFDLTVHLAAIVGGRAKIDGDPLAVAQNIVLDAEFFRWAARTKQPRVVYYSSSAVYPTWKQTDIWEGCTLHEMDVDLRDTQLGVPDQTYGWAKLTGEYLARYAVDAGVKVHIFRPFSGYGWDQSLDYPFPSFAQRAREVKDTEGHRFDIWGSDEQTRDWIHISDVVEATLTAVDEDVRGPVNLCTGHATAMGDLARLFCYVLGFEPQIEVDTSKPMGVMHRVGDPTLMSEFYTPKISVERGVREALDRIF